MKPKPAMKLKTKVKHDPRNLLTSLVLVFPLFLVYQVGVLFTLPMLNGADFLTVFLFRNLGLSTSAYLGYTGAVASSSIPRSSGACSSRARSTRSRWAPSSCSS